MSAPRVACLDDFELAAIIDGTCAPDVLSALLEHANGCASCRAVLTGLMAEGGTNGDPLEGLSVGHYRFGPLLAEGGMGRVYRAVDLDLDRAVAIKVPRANSPALKQRFEREISISVRLAHPGVVPSHGTGKLPDGTPFYVMRFVDGDSLDVLQGRTKTIAERLALIDTLITVAETMGHVHSQHIAHRDLKPNNVLVGRFGEVVIIDWGLAKELPQRKILGPRRPSFENIVLPDAPIETREISDEPIEIATRAGDILGTPAFMAPEQAKGEAVDRRADVYALGAMLWHLLTGRIPRSDAPFDDTVLVGVPLAIVAVTKRAMSADREARYPDAAALAKALRDASRDQPTSEPKHRRWPVLLATAIVVVGATGGLAMRRHRANKSSSAVSNVVTIEPMGTDVPNNVTTALSPSGNRVAIGSQDRLVVHDLITGNIWTSLVAVQTPVTLQFDSDDSLTIGEPTTYKPSLKLIRWSFKTGKTVELPTTIPANASRWMGSLDHSELFSPIHADRKLFIFDNATGQSIDVTSDSFVDLLSIAPNRQRFAFADSGKYRGVIRVVDSGGRNAFSSDEMSSPTALTWFDDNTLLYAITSSSGKGTDLLSAKATADGMRHPTKLYHYEEADHWLGGIASSGGRIIASLTISTFQSTLVDAFGNRTQTTLDRNAFSAPLAWRDANSFWTWNLATGNVELHHLDNTPSTILPIRLSDNPANATRAGDTLIVALRSNGGRRIEAYSLTDGTLRWTAAMGVLQFVRCAGDAAPPCIAGRVVDNVRVELGRIDPATGIISDVVVGPSALEDAAVSADGNTIAFAPNDSKVITQAFAADAVRTPRGELLPQSNVIYSIVFGQNGDIFITRRAIEAEIQIIHVDDRVEKFIDSGANILSLIRPSPDGAHVLFRARRFDAELARIVLPPAILASMK